MQTIHNKDCSAQHREVTEAKEKNTMFHQKFKQWQNTINKNNSTI